MSGILKIGIESLKLCVSFHEEIHLTLLYLNSFLVQALLALFVAFENFIALKKKNIENMISSFCGEN